MQIFDPKLYGYRSKEEVLMCKKCAESDPFGIVQKTGIKIYGGEVAGVQCRLCGEFLRSTLFNYLIDTTHPYRRKTVVVTVEA